jgi:uncharacterized protein YkwD
LSRTPALLACLCAATALLTPTASAAATAEEEAIAALNDVRRAHGLPALHLSRSLGRSSERYARKMIRRDYFGHGSEIDVAGGFNRAGETLAWHGGWNPQPRQTVRRWMASSGHRAVLLSSSFRKVGIGLARGRLGSRIATTWVAHVASP